MSYYSTLGVPEGTELKDCEIAYRKLVKVHHPDRGGKAEEMVKINQAIEALRKGNQPFISTIGTNEYGYGSWTTQEKSQAELLKQYWNQFNQTFNNPNRETIKHYDNLINYKIKVIDSLKNDLRTREQELAELYIKRSKFNF
jgi:hypothetical protein